MAETESRTHCIEPAAQHGQRPVSTLQTADPDHCNSTSSILTTSTFSTLKSNSATFKNLMKQIVNNCLVRKIY